MGLDTVEMVIAVEDEFAISIPDGAAAEMVKVKDLVDFVFKVSNGVEPWESDQLWNDLNQKFERVTGNSILDISVDTDVRTLLQPGKEAKQLDDLGWV